MKKGTKIFIAGFVFGMLCFFGGLEISSAIVMFSGYYNQWVFSAFAFIFMLVLIQKFKDPFMRFFKKTKWYKKI